MKKWIVILLIALTWIPQPAHAVTPVGTLGNIPYLQLGARYVPLTSSLFYLVAFVSTNGRYGTFRRTSEVTASVGYTPSAGKKFRIYGGWTSSGIAAINGGYMGYANTNVDTDSSGSPTSPIPFGGVNGLSNIISKPATNLQMVPTFAAPDWEIPNGKYGYLLLNTGTDYTVYLVGEEI